MRLSILQVISTCFLLGAAALPTEDPFFAVLPTVNCDSASAPCSTANSALSSTDTTVSVETPSTFSTGTYVAVETSSALSSTGTTVSVEIPSPPSSTSTIVAVEISSAPSSATSSTSTTVKAETPSASSSTGTTVAPRTASPPPSSFTDVHAQTPSPPPTILTTKEAEKTPSTTPSTVLTTITAPALPPPVTIYTTVTASADPNNPAGVPSPPGPPKREPVVAGIPPFGHMYAGKPTYQCWYDKTPFFNHFHLQATNWNKTEHEVKQACKVRLITDWDWVEEHNQAGMQMFSVVFNLPILSASALEKSLNKFLKPMGYQFPDLPKVKCSSKHELKYKKTPGGGDGIDKWPGRQEPAYPGAEYPDYGVPPLE